MPEEDETMTMTTKPGEVKVRMDAMRARQKREGYSMGYIGHACRLGRAGAATDAVVLEVLTERGYDQDDAYFFLNSRVGRHLGDALHGAAADDRKLIIEREAPKTPAAMYADWGEDKAAQAEAFAIIPRHEKALAEQARELAEAARSAAYRRQMAAKLAGPSESDLSQALRLAAAMRPRLLARIDRIAAAMEAEKAFAKLHLSEADAAKALDGLDPALTEMAAIRILIKHGELVTEGAGA
jgi:hypothetical protein